jgi:hypothetical protein
MSRPVEHLFCKHQALSSNPSPSKKKKKKKGPEVWAAFNLTLEEDVVDNDDSWRLANMWKHNYHSMVDKGIRS